MRKEEKKTSRCHEHSAAPRSTSPSNIQGKAAAILARTFNDVTVTKRKGILMLKGGSADYKNGGAGCQNIL
jgi:hypothetical protein